MILQAFGRHTPDNGPSLLAPALRSPPLGASALQTPRSPPRPRDGRHGAEQSGNTHTSAHGWRPGDMAHPFSAVPTPYPLRTPERTCWADRTWDAFGIAGLLGVD
jgi:hypothetical protein